MKRYRKRTTALATQWDGTPSSISELKSHLKIINRKDDVFKVGICDDGKIAYISHKEGIGTSNRFVSIGEYIVIDSDRYGSKFINVLSEYEFEKKYIDAI